MQKLHLIGFTTDLDGLIFSARRGTKSGGFTVAVDDDLIRTVEEVMRLRSSDEAEEWEEGEEEQPTSAWRVTVPQPESVLTPREIQARLRTGASLAEVAEEAGVDEEWVARFAPPVWAEQSRIIATAQRLTLEKPRVGLSAETLGASVRVNLNDRGSFIDDEAFDAAWGAYHVSGTTWVITFDPPGRTRRQVAMWQLDTAAETVAAANRSAADLGYATAKARQRRRQHDGANEAALARVARTATKKSAARQQEAKSASESKARKKKAAARIAKRPVAVRVPARKAAPKKAAPKKAAPKKAARPVAASRKAAAKKIVARKSAAKKSAAKKSVAKKATSKRVPAKRPAPKKTPAPRKPEPVAQARVPVMATTGPASPPPQRVWPEPARPVVTESERIETPAMAAAREERRRAREARRAQAQSDATREREPAPPRLPPLLPPPPAIEPAEQRPEPPAEAYKPAPPVIAAAVASDEASGRVVRIHANRAAPVPVEAAASSRRARQAERRRRRMFRGD